MWSVIKNLIGHIFTDRIRSTREGNVFSLFTPGGGYPGQVWGGEYPSQVQRGVPLLDGYPILGTPLSKWLGYPDGGTPPWVPPVGPGQGVPQLGEYPTSGTTPHQTWPGGTLMGGTPPQVPPPPVRPGQGGVPHLVQDNRWST